MFAGNKESKVILGPVVKAGLEALKVSLSTVVLNNRDRHKETQRPAFTCLNNNILYPKNQLKCIGNTIITLYLH